MYTCFGTRAGMSSAHQHELVIDAKRCYGILPTPAPVPSAPEPFPFGNRANPTGPLSLAQYHYIRDLKGDCSAALEMSYYDASTYITRLKGGRSVSTPIAPNPKLELVKGLIGGVPKGYYGVQEFEGGHVEFMRLSEPKSGQYAGAKKFQTIHGSGLGARLDVAAVLWPSGKWSIYKPGIVEQLMLLCADYQTAALRYAEKFRRCCRCNAQLTDGRSRWFGIGPECETMRPDVIENILITKGPFTGER